MPFIAIHWSFSLYFGWQTSFWKQDCKAESQYCSLFTQVEHTNASSPLLFLQQLECLSFLLLIPLCSLFDSYSSKIPLQKMFSLSAMAFSFFSLPTKLYRATYKFFFWSCLLHLPHTFFPLHLIPGHRFLATFIQFQFSGTCFPDSVVVKSFEKYYIQRQGRNCTITLWSGCPNCHLSTSSWFFLVR